ncbi:MAG: hypothetical protein AVDCRST_MAG30-1936, partial [uncultured Solirubrobacteraceae bacterium]
AVWCAGRAWSPDGERPGTCRWRQWLDVRRGRRSPPPSPAAVDV